MNVKVLVISGAMGAGKTTVLGEVSDVLAARAIPHAAIDLDAVAAVLLPEEALRAAMSNPELVVCVDCWHHRRQWSIASDCVNPECTKRRLSHGRDPWMRS